MCTLRRWMKLTALALAGALLVACGGGSSSAGDGEHAGGHEGESSVVEPVDGAPEVTLTATDIDYAPATLELTAGEPTNVTIVNEGEAMHDFTLEAAGIHANLEPGQEITLGVTVDEPGTYEALCTVAGHAEAGMTVEVIVS